MKLATSRRTLVLMSCAWGLFTFGCATSTISFVRTDLPNGALTTDTVFIIGTFDSTHTPSFGDGHESEEVVALQRSRLSEEIETRLVRHFRARGLQAGRAGEQASTNNAVLIEGQITLNDRGSWAMRVWLGGGSGRTHLKTSVQAYRAGSSGLLFDLDTTATSGASSGWYGIGDFIPTDSENTAIRIVNYVEMRLAVSGESNP